MVLTYFLLLLPGLFVRIVLGKVVLFFLDRANRFQRIPPSSLSLLAGRRWTPKAGRSALSLLSSSRPGGAKKREIANSFSFLFFYLWGGEFRLTYSRLFPFFLSF